jgi:2-polyprenyl-3-methyl-5-hydroxy-6-metoxy-1,4-benzoquinol methylase
VGEAPMMEQKNLFAQLWKESAVSWEKSRYFGPLSKLFYSSLRNRMDYLSFVVEQAPAGTRIIELGCGSGLLFGKLKNKADIHYSGYDISSVAIEEAKKRWGDVKNAQWFCLGVDTLPDLSCDIVVSAGLLDWLTDDQIERIGQKIRSKHFVHSFSLRKAGIKTWIHNGFTTYLRRIKKAAYSPRKFSVIQIKKLLGENVNIVCNSELSFGCFAHNLDSGFITDYNVLKTKRYFSKKAGKAGLVEMFVKKTELAALKGELKLVNGKKILEVGSGAGLYTKALVDSGAYVTAIDGFVETLKYVSHPHLTFMNVSLENAQLSETFDAIFLLGVLEFVQDEDSFIARLARLARLNSNVFLLYPANESFFSKIYFQFHNLKGRKVTIYPEIKLLEIFKKNGFHLIGKRSAGPLNNLFTFKKEL